MQPLDCSPTEAPVMGFSRQEYWSFSFSIIPSKEIPGLISFRMDWLSPGSMHDTGCLGLVHWDDPEGWNGEGGGRRVQDSGQIPAQAVCKPHSPPEPIQRPGADPHLTRASLGVRGPSHRLIWVRHLLDCAGPRPPQGPANHCVKAWGFL